MTKILILVTLGLALSGCSVLSAAGDVASAGVSAVGTAVSTSASAVGHIL